MGEDDEGSTSVYIGKANKNKDGESVIKRIGAHNDNDKLNNVKEVIFITNDSSEELDSAETSWLENRLYNVAEDAQNCDFVVNKLEPHSGNLGESDKANLEPFFEGCKIVIKILGYPIFDKIDETAKLTLTLPNSRGGQGRAAHGVRTGSRFTILKDSYVCTEFTLSCPQGIIELRKNHSKDIGSDGLVKENIKLRTANQAAQFCWYASANRDLWKLANGKSED